MSVTPRFLGLALLLILFALGGEGDAKKIGAEVWADAVSYRSPPDAAARTRVSAAADWLKRHLTTTADPGDKGGIRVIAWKDPTLDPENPQRLAGYLITDTLWSAKALKPFDPATSRQMERDLQRLGWYGNGLHDVLFHPLEKILHCPADPDFVHGWSLGHFPTVDGRSVDLRVFRQKWDADFDVGHPQLFAEHAVYRALYDFWQGRTEPARRRLRDAMEDDRDTDARDRIFWDRRAGILVDYVNFEPWLAFRDGKRPTCRHYTFKLGVFLYAIRLLGMERDLGPARHAMNARLWSAQREHGGVAHFVDVRSDGTAETGLDSTGEATAIAILAETVEPTRP